MRHHTRTQIDMAPYLPSCDVEESEQNGGALQHDKHCVTQQRHELNLDVLRDDGINGRALLAPHQPLRLYDQLIEKPTHNICSIEIQTSDSLINSDSMASIC